MKAKFLVNAVLFILEALAKTTETEIDDIVVKRIRNLLRKRKKPTTT